MGRQQKGAPSAAAVSRALFQAGFQRYESWRSDPESGFSASPHGMVVFVTWNRGSDTFGMLADERDALAAEFVGKYAKTLRELGYPVEQSTRYMTVTGPKQKKK